MSERKNILLFDGNCNLCNSTVKFIKKHDRQKQFSFVPLQSLQGETLLKTIGLPVGALDTVVYIRNEKYFLRSTAGLYIFKDIGGIWTLLFVLIIIPKSVRDFFYKLIAKTRYALFGSSHVCIIPTPDINKYLKKKSEKS